MGDRLLEGACTLHRCIGCLSSTIEFVLRAQVHKDDRPSDLFLIVHSDSDYPPPEMRPQSCACVYLTSERGSYVPISFYSKRQPLCSDSTPSAECVAVHLALKSVIQCEILLGDLLSRRSGGRAAPMLRIDSPSCLSAMKKGFSSKLGYLSKSLGIRLAFATELIDKRVVDVSYVPSRNNRSDIGTKALPTVPFQEG
eukprot:GHVN01093013.1.p1 GENE.GHVN01093013.1~~GHVN01093013.1.p1  ORF type:complete len:197 (+),score=3.60 GHVN01093013.1:216-806(+)